MDVVWSHQDRAHRIPVEDQILVWEASVTSWIVYAPWVKRILYADEKTLQMLTKAKVDVLWDEIKVIDFDQELEGISWYSAPRYLVWSLQKDPFFGIDWDVCLTEALSSQFNYNQFALDSREWNGRSDYVKDFQDLEPLLRFWKTATLGRLIDNFSAFGGVIYVPNPDLFSVICLAQLEWFRRSTKFLGERAIPTRFNCEITTLNFLRKVGIVDFQKPPRYIHYDGAKKFNLTQEILMQDLHYSVKDVLQVYGIETNIKTDKLAVKNKKRMV